MQHIWKLIEDSMKAFNERLSDLEVLSNNLKIKLLAEQLKLGIYSYENLKKDMMMVLKSYKSNHSLVKSAYDLNLNPNLIIQWYLNGQMGLFEFKYFHDEVNNANNLMHGDMSGENVEKDYKISQLDNVWVYNCNFDGKSYSIIANDFNRLKKKVLDKNLPMD